MTTYDVIVVGAGASGLNCARLLSREGLSVVVYEARERLGGRIHTHQPADGGPPLELGAQVVHGDRNPVHELLGPGRTSAVPRRVTARIVEGGADRPMGSLSSGRRAPWQLEAMLWRSPGVTGLSVGSRLRACGSTGAEAVAALEWFRQNWAADPEQLSAAGVAEAHRGDDVGEGEFAVEGGFARLPERLAEGLDGRLRLGEPVRELAYEPGRVTVRTDAGTSAARALVLTVPPAVPVPGLPAWKLAAAADLPAGDGCCAVITLDRPASDTVIVFDVDGRTGFTRCTAGRPEVLVVAKAGAAATLRAAGADRTALSALLATALPWTSGAAVLDVAVADWGQDPYAAGAFTAPRAGLEDAARRWAEPVDDTLFFAGEATVAGERLPWVQGALASGERAAEQVLKALR
ncbi:flavin monoamine oxidase family protein [Kitasatospora cathayae]|uniref:NAD(P)/FAD-dependent oxidoreductase n=1 Tax=Kitasatospora cathayae TaxID=3004092 RepID=A0ABY7Q4P2_9ACTN|nr:NAD(P)/FAD-dependent oxidoreductase [Kitasatospora sp. HUAS 3-15]WBP87623.1 NAD(P)/FAD-dependent oxidoreductase [Kitasatospora sp. HUAS 3-15]